MSEDYGSIKIEGPEEKPAKTNSGRNRKKSRRKPEKQQQTAIEQSVEENTPKKRVREKRKEKEKKLISPLSFAAFFLIFLMLASGVAIYATPHFIKKYLPSYLESHSDFSVRLDRVKFNPIKSQLIFIDLEIERINNSDLEPLLTIPKATLELVPSALLKKQLVTNRTTVDGAKLTIKRNQNENSNFEDDYIDDIKNYLNLKALPINISLNNIEFTNGLFTFIDNTTNTSHEGEDISFGIPTISNFSYGNLEYIDPYFSAKINGSPVTFSTDKNSSNNDSFVYNLENIDLAQYFNYLPLNIPFDFEQGISNGQLEIIFNKQLNSDSSTALRFDLKVTNTVVKHGQQDATITAPEVSVSASFFPTNSQLAIHNLQLENPKLTLPNSSKLSDLSRLFPRKEENSSNRDAGAVTLENFSITGGTVLLGNEASRDAKTIDKLQVNFSHKNDVTGNLTLSGNSNNTSFTWNAKLENESAKGDFSINNFSLSHFFEKEMVAKPEGKGNLKGVLSINREQNTGFSYEISSMDITINNASLDDWLRAEQLTVKNGFYSESSVNFGDVVIGSGALRLKTNKLPSLFTNFTTKNSRYRVKSVQFTGTAQMSSDTLSPLDIASFSLTATNLDSSKPETDNLDFSATFANSENSKISGKGRTKLKGFSLWISTTFENLPSKEVLPYIYDNSLFNTTDTFVSGKGIFTLPAKSFKGSFVTGKTRFGTKTSKKIQWAKATIKDLEYKTKPENIQITNVAVSSPRFGWTRKPNDYSPSLQLRYFFNDILSGGDIKKTERTPVSINNLSIDNGSVSIIDTRVNPQLKTQLSKINGTIKKLDNSGSTSAVFSINADAADSPMKLEGTVNFFGQGKPHEYKLVFDTLQKTTFFNELKKRTPYNFNSTDTSVTIFQQKRGKEVNSITDINLINASSSDKALDLVLAMKHEGSSDTKISILTQQQHPNRDVSFLKEVEKSIGKMIIKAETSPFLLSKDDFSDLAEKEYVDFRFGEVALTGNGMETLIRLREFLTLHPFVDLEIRGEASEKVDYQVLLEKLEEKEQQRVDDLNNKRYSEWDALRQKKIEEEGTILDDDPFTEEDIFIPLQPEMVTVPKEVLIELANQRAILIGQVFTEQLALEPHRLKIVETKNVSETMENVVRLKVIGPKRDKNNSEPNPLDDPFESEISEQDPFETDPFDPFEPPNQ